MSSFPKKCEHGKVKYTCVPCEGGGICGHKRNRAYCKECKGSAICPHGKDKYHCVECDYKKKPPKLLTPLEKYEMSLNLEHTKRKCYLAKL